MKAISVIGTGSIKVADPMALIRARQALKDKYIASYAEPDFRQEVTDIARLFVRNRDGGMVPLDTLTTWQQSSGARFMQRYNLYRTAAFSGTPAPGASSGDAIRAIAAVGYDEKSTRISCARMKMRQACRKPSTSKRPVASS